MLSCQYYMNNVDCGELQCILNVCGERAIQLTRIIYVSMKAY